MNCQYIPFFINGIIAIIAILATYFTSKASNRHQEKLREIDFQNKIYNDDYRHLQSLFEEFLRCSGTACSKKYPVDAFVRSHYALFPYIPIDKQIYFERYASQMFKARDNKHDAEEIMVLLKGVIVPIINEILEEKKSRKRV